MNKTIGILTILTGVTHLLGALFMGVPTETLAWLSGLYVLSRVAYIACYLGDYPTWRTLCWVVGYGLVIALFVLALLRLA